MTRELAASRQKAIDAKSDYLSQIAAMSEEIEETRRELKIQESFVYQLAETNKELESENATQVAGATDAKDRGRALLRDDSVRTSKRHNSKTRKSDTTNRPQQQGQGMEAGEEIFQAEEVRSCLSQMRRGKTTGISKVSVELLQQVALRSSGMDGICLL